MENFLETFSIAAILIVIALLMIGLSWLLTGKQKVKGGTCGRDPNKDKNDECGTKASCTLCENGGKKDQESCEKKEPESDDE